MAVPVAVGALSLALVAAGCALQLVAGSLVGSAHAQGGEADFSAPVLRFLSADNRELAGSAALAVSRRVTHDRSLPRSQESEITSDDPENFRLELIDPGESADVVYARLEARRTKTREVRSVLRHVPLVRVPSEPRFRSPFLRLVSDAVDVSAPDVGDRLLRVALRDRVHAVVERAGAELESERSVGELSGPIGPRRVLRGTVRTTVLRSRSSGQPVVGDSDEEAIDLARSQIEIANEIWAQCFIEFGDPERAEVRVIDPPPRALLAFGDVDGLPAAGAGSIVFRAGGQLVGPVATHAGASPERTARDVARALEKRGFAAAVSVNPATGLGAGASADVVVRDAKGALVELGEEPGTPLSSDRRQRASIGSVDMSDGIDEFDNALSMTGTLEERTLVKLVADADPTTIDVIVINRFVNPDRQGEAFIEADESSTPNVLVFDRNAVRFERQAWVQAHELGHVLLDEAFHPDNFGPDRPWLLMDADARQGRITGPKRLSDEECAKARRRSGPGAHPVLLKAME